MSKIMYSQKWYSYYDYPLDYFELLYQYYATSGIRTPVTYYSFDITNSVLDKDVLAGGAYEMFGPRSGYRWMKINMLPVYGLEQLQMALNGDEHGVQFVSNTSFYIPSVYEIQPRIHDFLIYDQLQNRDDPLKLNINMYEVINIEKSSQTKITFWKATLRNFGLYVDDIENQLSGNYTFVDYEKQIYNTQDAIHLQKLLIKNDKLKINDFYNKVSGLYMEKPGFKVAEQTNNTD